MEHALRLDDGKPYSGDTVYVDGYGIEERLLEGVRFEVKLVTEEGVSLLACKGVHPEDVDYMRKFSSGQLDTWYTEAVEQLTRWDSDAKGTDGKNVHWGES